MKRLLLLLCGIITLALPAHAFTYEYKGQTFTYAIYNVSERTCVLKDGRSATGAVELPEEPIYNGTPYTLIAIGDEAFRDCRITSIEIPNSVREIGDIAFGYCSSLTSIKIPNSVREIGYYAFRYCSSLTSVVIPNSVKEIGHGAFRECTRLTSVVIPNSIQEIGEFAFYGCSLTSVVIPNSIQEIGDYAFSNCSSLTSVVIPNSVQNMGYGVFEECTGLIKSAYPDNISNPFDNGLAIAYPNKGTTIDENECVFSQSGIYFVPYYISGDCTLSGPIEAIGDYTFALCSGLTSLELPNSVTQIGASAFKGCTNLASVELPNSLTQIGANAFQNCSSLTSVVIPGLVQNIGTSAFEGCSGLIKSAYPDNISNPFSNGLAIKYTAGGTTLENGCVVGKSTLYFVPYYISGDCTLSGPIEVIGDYTFALCSGLTSLELPNSVTQIGANAFQGCSELASVELSNSLTQIGASAFKGCTNLASLELPSSLTQIGANAFQSCSSLTSVVIPGLVQNIGTSAFEGCFKLTSVELLNSVKEIGASAFKGCTNLASLELPNSLTQIGANAFQSCSSLTSVVIPGLVQNIGTSAFEGCSGLIKSAYPDNISNPFSNGLAIAYPNKGTTLENGCVVGKSTLYFAPVTLSGVYTVPSTITAIGENAFALCKDITYIRMPATLSSIGKNAFEDCNLYDFTIPNSVKVFDMGLLAGNPLKSLTVGSGVTQITGSEYFQNSGLEKIFWLGNIPPIGYAGFKPVVNFVSNDQYLFANQILYPFLSSIFEVDGIVYVPVSPSERTCNVVDYLYAPSNAQFSVPSTITNQGIQMKVIDVGAYAFYHHDYLTDISLDNNGAIDDYAFYDCLKLKSVTFGDNIPEIKNHTFQNCEVLERVENSPALTSIGNWAFSGCVGMDYFSVGNKIKSFGEEAFSDCTGLTKFYTSATTLPECGAQALDDIIKWNCTLYVPLGTESLYASSPQWKDFFFIEGTSGVESVMTDAQTETEIFDLNGIKQTRPIEDLTSGIYIIRQGSKVTKKLIK